MWGLAQVDLARNDRRAAAPRLVAAFDIFNQLERPDGIAIVGEALGRLLRDQGRGDEAGEVFRIGLAAAAKVGPDGLARRLRSLLGAANGRGTGGSPAS
jgi:hypothetical protein